MHTYYYYILKRANIYSCHSAREDEEVPENIFEEVTVNSEEIYNSSAPQPIGCVLSPNLPYDIKVGNFLIKRTLSGSIWHKDGFGKCWELSCQVKDLEFESFDNLIISGGAFTNSFGFGSVVGSIASFFNKLQQFENLEDWHLYHNAQKSNTDREQEEKDAQIFSVGELINLFAKYKALNPVSPITKNLQQMIESQLKDIMQ